MLQGLILLLSNIHAFLQKSAERGSRTPTRLSALRILSPPRLPVPPSRRATYKQRNIESALIPSWRTAKSRFSPHTEHGISGSAEQSLQESCAYSQFRHLGINTDNTFPALITCHYSMCSICAVLRSIIPGEFQFVNRFWNHRFIRAWFCVISLLKSLQNYPPDSTRLTRLRLLD
jgi:hypothetical protein